MIAASPSMSDAPASTVDASPSIISTGVLMIDMSDLIVEAGLKIIATRTKSAIWMISVKNRRFWMPARRRVRTSCPEIALANRFFPSDTRSHETGLRIGRALCRMGDRQPHGKTHARAARKTGGGDGEVGNIGDPLCYGRFGRADYHLVCASPLWRQGPQGAHYPLHY